MSVKITTLIENNAGENLALKTEHGISFFIEKDGYKLLFDSGQTGTFIENAKQLRVDLSALEAVVLSHGHYDHSGGIRPLSKLTTDFKLYMGQGFFDEKYGFKNNAYEYLGNNFDEKFLEEQGIAYQFVDQPLLEIIPGVYVVTQFPRKYQDEVINSRFKVMKNGVFQPDSFEDEVLLAVDTAEGLVVLLGCSHPGMKNMLDAVADLLPRPIYAILGGTHLVEASYSSLGKSMSYLNNDSLKVIGVSHCTGQIAMDQLAASNSRYYHNRTGSSLIVV
ncbi:MAG: MBL fold metallo-hydrolase [Deltaproteobacteria bacterium]|jgi:7,8-dihydropterin-6-yl-methyl-4-(beta-D-ribofuranosyl)aminobenzene 5'-phosphate synthase|nr:MBL fold metallo-hydrolase [Deltaproteobacteria bacterium]MCW8891833.1 MBL fold metallo-hydrolase [Deltaproteobacteria bacterium]MCW9050390.1 MBL fold metallo-hydrolase [Deltaproteobacteria bacterium]